MQHLVIYESVCIKGNVPVKFLHFPPTLEDIRNLEEDISRKFCQNNLVTVTGWYEIADEISEN